MKVQYEQRGHFHCAPVPPGPCLAVLMPCFNESRTVGEIAHRVLAQEVVAQLVIVDDGSTDGTWEHLQVLSKDGRVQILKHPGNMGKGAAIRTADGRVFAGANIEVASYPEGWCAETTALGLPVASAITRPGWLPTAMRRAASTASVSRPTTGRGC